jgi:hypothetical protein
LTFNHINIFSSKSLFSYYGPITFDWVNAVLNDLKLLLRKNGLDSKIINRIYHITNECLENIYHSNTEDNFSVEIYNLNKYVLIKLISVTNLSSKKEITKKLDTIKLWNEEELKEKKNEILLNKQYSEQGTGGVGLIDLAIISQNQIDYSFKRYKNNQYLYSISIKINK